jgi:hypothetical protein
MTLFFLWSRARNLATREKHMMVLFLKMILT